MVLPGKYKSELYILVNYGFEHIFKEVLFSPILIDVSDFHCLAGYLIDASHL